MHVIECCSRRIAVVRPGASVSELARLMREYHVGSLVVVDGPEGGDGRPVGMVTDRDLVMQVLAKDVWPASVTARDLMSTTLETARADDEVLQTLGRMRALGVRRMPVVDASGALVGILAVDDVLDVLAESMRQIQQLFSTETAHEAQRRP